jgi:hypothetical protein
MRKLLPVTFYGAEFSVEFKNGCVYGYVKNGYEIVIGGSFGKTPPKLDEPTKQRVIRAVSEALRPARELGIRMAAEFARQYDSVTLHKVSLEDCILGKLGLLKGKPKKNSRNISIGEMERAKRLALSEFEKWVEVTGMIPPRTSYYYEVAALIEDAVEWGAGLACCVSVKTIRERIAKEQKCKNL